MFKMLPMGHHQRRRRLFRRIILLTASLLVFILTWFTAGRLTAPSRAIHTATTDIHTTSATQPARSSLRIACWNIAHGRGLAESNWDGGDAATRSQRLHAIADVLRAADLDIVILNEIDFDTTWSHNLNQAEFLARHAGFPHRVEQCSLDISLPLYSLRIGNAILSRHPITDATLIDLPSPDRLESLLAGHKRGVDAIIHPRSASPVRIIGLHLEHRYEPVRVRSAEIIRDRIEQSSVPVIVAGDLNTGPAGFPHVSPDADGRTGVDVLTGAGRLALPPQVQPTLPWFTYRADHPVRILDWILAPPDWQVINYEVIPTDLSDHRMVIATLQPPPPPATR